MCVIGTISYRCFVVGIANAYHSEISTISLARREFVIFMTNEAISKLSTMKILNKLIHSQVILPTCCLLLFFRCVFTSLPFLSGQLLAHSQTRLRRRRLGEHSKKKKREIVCIVGSSAQTTMMTTARLGGLKTNLRSTELTSFVEYVTVCCWRL